VLIQPALDYGQLSAGAGATEVIRAEAGRLGIGGLRLTGPVPMADDEFATVAQGAVENTILSFGLVAILLWMALRSFRLIWPLLALVVVGLLWTAGFGSWPWAASTRSPSPSPCCSSASAWISASNTRCSTGLSAWRRARWSRRWRRRRGPRGPA
jgi:hypothetical protein